MFQRLGQVLRANQCRSAEINSTMLVIDAVGGLAPHHISTGIPGSLTPIASLQISFINFFLLGSAFNEPGQPNPVMWLRAVLGMLQGFFLLHVISLLLSLPGSSCSRQVNRNMGLFHFHGSKRNGVCLVLSLSSYLCWRYFPYCWVSPDVHHLVVL